MSTLHRCCVSIDNTHNSYPLVLSAIAYQVGTFSPPLTAGGSQATTVPAGASMALSLDTSELGYGAHGTLQWTTGPGDDPALITMDFRNVILGSNIATIEVSGSAAALKAYGVSYLYASAGDSTGTAPMARDCIAGGGDPLRVNYTVARNSFVDNPKTFLPGVEHVVLYMLENRSLDHLLGMIYTAASPPSHMYPATEPLGYHGLDTVPDYKNFNPNTNEWVWPHPVPAGEAFNNTPNPDPGEAWEHVNTQVFNGGDTAGMGGFITDYLTQTDDDNADSIMAYYTPAELPVLSGLATGYAVSDNWFSAVPTQTNANRAFSIAGTSGGLVDNENIWAFRMNTLFNVLSNCGDSDWALYHQDGWLFEPCYTAYQFDALDPLLNSSNVRSVMTDFVASAQAGTLPAFSYLEPAWFEEVDGLGRNGNDYHPYGNLAPGEQALHAIYTALTSNPAAWAKTLFIVTFDEHGGTFDHMAPPGTIAPDQQSASPQNFDFTRLGVRVPTLLISPLVAAGTVFRAPDPSVGFDHTSLLKTILGWRGIDISAGVMGARAAVASDFSGVLSASAVNTGVLAIEPRPWAPEGPEHPLNDLQRALIPALAHSIVRGPRGSAEHRALAAHLATQATWGQLKSAALQARARHAVSAIDGG